MANFDPSKAVAAAPSGTWNTYHENRSANASATPIQQNTVTNAITNSASNAYKNAVASANGKAVGTNISNNVGVNPSKTTTTPSKTNYLVNAQKGGVKANTSNESWTNKALESTYGDTVIPDVKNASTTPVVDTKTRKVYLDEDGYSHVEKDPNEKTKFLDFSNFGMWLNNTSKAVKNEVASAFTNAGLTLQDFLMVGQMADPATAENVDKKAYDNWADGVRAKNDERASTAEHAKNQAKIYAGGTKTAEIVTDIAVTATEMFGDMIVSALTGGTGGLALMGTRTFGQSAMEARQSGATLDQQVAYGAANAAIEVISEKLFAPLDAIYGKGFADDVLETAIGKIAGDSKLGTAFIKFLVDFVSEGGEEGFSDFGQVFSKLIYDNQSVANTFGTEKGKEEFYSGLLYDFLLGGILGGFGSIVGSVGENINLNTNSNPLVAPTVVAEQTQPTKSMNDITNENSSATKAANVIFNNPTLYEEYVKKYGEPEGTSKTEKIGNMATVLHQQNLNNQYEQKGTQYGPAKPVNDFSNQTIDVSEEPIIPSTKGEDNAIGNVMHIREMQQQEGGITFANATEILNNPELRSTFEQMYGITLPSSNTKARQVVMEYSNSPFDVNEFNVNTNPLIRNANTQTESAPTMQQQEAAQYGAKVVNDFNNNGTAQNSTQNTTNTNSQPNAENSAEAVKPGVSSKSEQTTQNTEQTAKEEPPIADYNVARNTEEGMKEYPPKERERNGSKYSKEDKALAPEIRKSYEDDPDTYSVKHNKETLRNALDKIDNLGVDGATADLLQRIGAAENDGAIKTALGKGSITADDVPMAKVLANELNKQGRTAEARELLSSMFAEATRAGQFIQAFSLLRNVDSPIVARMAIDKMLEKTNNKIAKQYKKSTYRAELTAEEEARLENLDYSNEEEFRDFVSDLSKRIGREMPRSFGEVFNEWRRIGMLSRPATHIGNFVANIPTAMMQRMNNFFDGAIQDIGAATKVELVGDEVPVYNEAENEWRCAVGEQIIRADTKRRCTFLAKAAKFGKSGTAFFSQKSYNLADSVYSQYKDTMSGKSNKWDRQQKGGLGFEDKTVFRGKALDRICGMLEASGMDLSKFKNGDVYDPSLLQTIGNGIYEMMELEDSLFVRNAFNTSLASYCEAHGITDANNIPKSAIESAMADAFYYTYKNSNVLSDMINELKSIPGVGVLVGTKIPFSTTPTNIGIMALEHNPFIAAAKGYTEYRKGEKAEARQSFSKGLTGTAIIGIGALLRGLGVLSSADDDDKDKVNFLKSIGQRGNALLGKYDLSQLEPAISLISFGAALKDTWDSGEAMSAESIVLDAVSKSLESVFEMDMVQNLAELFNGSENKYSKSGATQFIESLLLDIPPQVIPGFYQAIVNSVDPVNRYSYDTEGFKENLIAGLKYYSGIGRNTLAEKSDAKGNTSKGDKTTNAIDEILYPGKIAQGKADATDEYLMNLEETTGKKTMYPDTFSAGAKYKNAEGEEITVGVNETAKFQKTYSDTYLDAVNSLKDEKWFKALDGDEQLKIVSKYKSYAKDIAIAEAFKDQGKEYTSDTQTLINGDEEKGIPALGDKVFEYTAYKTMFDDSVKNEDYSTIDSFVSTFDDLDKTIKDVLFAKDSDIRSVVNAADDGVNATDYYSYKAQLKGAAEELNASTTGSNTKLLALSRAGLDTDTLEKVISNNTFGLSTTALAVVSVLCQPPYNYSLEDASNFLYEADYTINQKYETNDIIDMGLKSSNQATRILAKQLDNKTLEKTDENIEALRGALVAEDANLSGIDGGNSNGSLTNLEVANWLSKSGLNRKDAESIYYALRKELSNYYNDWGSYTYQSEVAYLPKATNKGWTYGREKQTETKTEEPTNYISNNALYRSAQKAKTGW